MNTNVTVTVKFFNDVKGFGFFTQMDGPDVFIHITTMEQFGFSKSDMVSGMSAIVDFDETEKRPIVTKVHKIGDKQAPPTERRTIVDRHGDLVAIKVIDLKTNESIFQVRKGAIDGKLVYNNVKTLVAVRHLIGKTIVHPIGESHGKRTNVPRQVVKKGDNGKSDKKAA